MHRQHQDLIAYTGAAAHTLQFTPLLNEIVPTDHLLEAVWFSSNKAQSCALAEIIHYTIVDKVVTVADLSTVATNPHTSAGIGASGFIRYSYTHAGY